MNLSEKLSLKRQIEEMYVLDQKSRKLAGGNRNELFYNILVYLVDNIHYFRIKEMIERHGYPTRKSLGVACLKKFWLLIQHQDSNSLLQKKCLENCDFAPKEKAYLTDRIFVNQGKKQIYGTQFYRKAGKLIPRPIKDRKNLDKLRKSVGLDSFISYQKEFKNRIKT